MHEYKEPVIIIAHFAELLKKNTSEISQNKRLDLVKMDNFHFSKRKHCKKGENSKITRLWTGNILILYLYCQVLIENYLHK